MKRTVSIIALALAIVMMMGCLAACGGQKVPTGTYKLTEVSGSGAEMYEKVKDSITLEVKDGGKATMSVTDLSSLELTFNESSGKVSLQDSEVPYKVDGNKIIIEDSSGKMVFEKQ